MMLPLFVFEDSQVERLYPLTYARPACELRVGAATLLERMQRNVGRRIDGLLVRSAVAEPLRRRLGGQIPVNPPVSGREGLLLLNARWVMLRRSGDLPWETPPVDTAGLHQSSIVWMHLSAGLAAEVNWSDLHEPRTLEAVLARVQRVTAKATLLDRPWQLLDSQRDAIAEDFAALGRAGDAPSHPGAHFLAAENIHLARGVKIWPGAVLDAQNGPIIVGEETEIRAHAVLTGPLAIGPHCVIRTAADIREDCSIGPGCRVGGEVIASVFLGHANKQHHGFVGQSILGEWVNLGAGTTTSNLKNTYGTVKMAPAGAEESTGRMFLGAIIADHAKLGIGTYLSTGSVVGFGSHVVVPRPPRFVPSFAWLTEKGMQRADFAKIEQIAALVMKRRSVDFTPGDHELFVRIAGEAARIEQFAWPDP